MMGYPVSDEHAKRLLEKWGAANRVGGPKGYPRIAPFVPQARGKDIEWTDDEVEFVGAVVQQLDDGDRLIVKLYFEPLPSGKRLKVNAISKKITVHHSKINQALDRCIGRVAQALSLPQFIRYGNNA